ncbi:unnamed protein product [Moneuplotes crassus]|uniref:RING-type domain-containing protein n=1 Tax=Euplotes crassus TaxID=5936 RepID=A0AAD1XRT4_EUPCR|nr:unnamed protein product [Moneuplotes crassus]
MESKSDYDCSICINTLVFPVKTSCGHLFCMKCMEKYLEQSPIQQCPMCRTKVKLEKLKVDKNVWKEVKDLFGDEIKERRKVVEEEIRKEKNIVKLKVRYGNKYELLKSFKTTKSGYENKHRWTVYVALGDKKVEAGSVIKSVEFKLDDSFGFTDIKKNFGPYEYACNGYGEFSIPIKITWQRWLKMEPATLDHPLKFEGKGSHKSFIVRVDKTLLEEKTGVKY